MHRILFLTLLTAVPALAGPLPNAFYEVQMGHNLNYVQVFQAGLFGNFGATGAAYNNPPGTLAQLVGELTGQESTDSEVQYFFRVNGPASTTPIPILITGSLYTRYSLADYVTSTNDISWSTLASVFAASYTDSGQFDSAFVSSGCAASGGQFASDCVAPEFLLPFILHLNILPGNLNVVTLNANTNYQYNVSPSTIGAGAQTSSFQAVVDPVISFDPSFDSSGYSLELSDGIVNAPEPGTIAFTVTGAALMGLRLKSRHTRSSAR